MVTAAVTVITPVAGAVVAAVEFPVAGAAAWNVANWVPGLTAKTIPCAEWPVWRQYTHIGFVSWTVNVATGKGPLTFVSGIGTLKIG
jgi:hypothetical protein